MADLSGDIWELKKELYIQQNGACSNSEWKYHKQIVCRLVENLYQQVLEKLEEANELTMEVFVTREQTSAW